MKVQDINFQIVPKRHIANSNCSTIVKTSLPKDKVKVCNDDISILTNSLDGRQVNFTYSSTGKKISAQILAKDNKVISIEEQNLPKELRAIDNPKLFNAYFKNTYIKISALSDGSSKIYINAKLLGGESVEDIVSRLYDNGYNDNTNSSHVDHVYNIVTSKGHDVTRNKIKDLMADAKEYADKYTKAKNNQSKCEKTNTTSVGTKSTIKYAAGGAVVGGVVSGAGIGAATYYGAQLGVLGGPVGVAVGAGLGAVVGGVLSLF